MPPEKVAFVGVGNRDKGDDAIGPLIIDRLKGKAPNAIDAGPTPEDFTGEIRRTMPKAIVFVDALFMKDLPPGAPAIAEIEEIGHYHETTHAYTMDVVMEYLKDETRADVFMIGIQPARIAFGEGLSPAMGDAQEKIVRCILAAIKKC